MIKAMFSLFLGAVLSASELVSGDHVIFFGDSITQLGDAPKGYVDLIRRSVKTTWPDREITITGKGVGGNKVPNLQRRLERDVLRLKPTKVVIYIGINDIWHWSKPHPVTKEPRQGTTPEAYQSGLESIIQTLQNERIEVLLCTPTVIGENILDTLPDTERLNHYAGIVRNLAKKFDCDLVDLRTIFIDHLRKHNTKNLKQGVLTFDQVHMNDAGNRLIAKSIGNALGVSEIDQPRVSMRKAAGLDLFLLIGQSNMVGRAKIPETEKSDIPKTWLFNDQGEWAPASSPLNRFSPIRKKDFYQGMGLGHSFAKVVAESSERRLGLIVNARGGSKIEEWEPGGAFYNNTLDRLKSAQASGTLKAVLWHQGEQNCDDTKYASKLRNLITTMRKDLNNEELPFLIGEIAGDFEVNRQLHQVANEMPSVVCVSATGLTLQDSVHFDAEGQSELGKRYAKLWLELFSR